MLLQNNVQLEERDYFKDPFSEAELRDLAAEVGTLEMFARRSPSLKNMGLAGKDLSEEEMLGLMMQEPRLIRRPIVRIGGNMVVGANLKAVAAALEG